MGLGGLSLALDLSRRFVLLAIWADSAALGLSKGVGFYGLGQLSTGLNIVAGRFEF